MEQIAENKTSLPDFDNTEIAFFNKSNTELKKTYFLFQLMKNEALVKLATKAGVFGVKWNLPFARWATEKTIFDQFCGGTDIYKNLDTAQKLAENNILTILDYGAEGKNSEKDFDDVMHENIKAIDFASQIESIPVISIKVTGLASNILLEKLHKKSKLSASEAEQFSKMTERIHTIAAHAYQCGVSIFIDAEETWMQNPIDEIAMDLMKKHNKDKVIVYNTYQLYLKDKLEQLKRDHQEAIKGNFLFGAKLVRGAYMEKERERAKKMGYPSPVQESKVDTDRDFDQAIRYCVEHFQKISVCCASHNSASNLLMATLIQEKGLDKSHPHLNFCQLYGMSDGITFNLANSGYNASKYLPYGPIKEVLPYLVRRAEENTSVTGEMGRELILISKEMKRRGLK
jgi:proline dehydrogenase